MPSNANYWSPQRLHVARHTQKPGSVPADDNVSDDEINKMTYEKACHWYSFDPGKDNQ